MRLSVIIVNYNVKYFLEQCLCSLLRATEGIAAEIFVVDNGSADGSIAYLEPRFPAVHFISSDRNLGFAKANNLAIGRASGEYILFLNPDTILPETTLVRCLQFFESGNRVGAVGVRMLDGGGKFLAESKRSFPAPAVAFFKMTGLAACFPRSRVFGRYALGYLAEKEIHPVDVLSGAFMMVSSEAIAQAGSFDERFFMYGEDIDLSYRIQQCGYLNYYLGTVPIIHFKGESTRKISLQYVRLFFSAMRLFVKKHYRGTGAWLMYTALQAAIFLRAVISVLATPFKLLERRFQHRGLKKPAGKLLLIGDAAATRDAAEIITAALPQVFFESVTPELFSGAANTGEVIFCMGDLTYGEAVSLLEQMAPGTEVKWFGRHSGSIVGSSHKDKNGEIYAPVQI